MFLEMVSGFLFFFINFFFLNKCDVRRRKTIICLCKKSENYVMSIQFHIINYFYLNWLMGFIFTNLWRCFKSLKYNPLPPIYNIIFDFNCCQFRPSFHLSYPPTYDKGFHSVLLKISNPNLILRLDVQF